MGPVELLNLLFQHSLLQLYTPIVTAVGFSHPLTLTIITAHNTLCLTYLMLIAALAFPTFRGKAWLFPVGITLLWSAVSVSALMTLHVPAVLAFAAVFPHGWLEFGAIAYWINTIRKATNRNAMPTCDTFPTIREYLVALASPKELSRLIRKDVEVSFRATKLSFKLLWTDLKKSYLITLSLIAVSALLETYVTPLVIFLV